MTWEVLPPARKQKGVAGLTLTLWRGSARYRARLILRIADPQLLALVWVRKDMPVSVALGYAEHAGQLRLTRGSSGAARFGAPTGRAGAFLALPLPLERFPGLRAGPEKLRAALEFDFTEDWIQATLPAWTSPAAAPPVAVVPRSASAPFTGVMAGPGPHAGVRRGSPVL